MKRVVLLLLSMTLILGGFGCGKKEEQKSLKTAKEIYQEITEKVELPDMTILDNEMIEGFYGMDIDTFSDYLFAESLIMIQVDSVVIVKLKDEKDIEDTKAKLQVMIDNKLAQMQNYLVDKYETVKKASVKSKGNTVYLVISERAEEIEAIIENNVV